MMKSMIDRLNKPYNSEETESRIYSIWKKSGFLNPDKLPNSRLEPFTIVMPPTNANGSLHAGHSLVMTIEDILVRYKRMGGMRTLWLPGLDHAGFETQVVYEKVLEKEGRSRFDLKPDELYGEIMEFTKNNSDNIRSQIKMMGASCDWSREKFTLDPDIVKIVYSTFQKLHKDELLYRGKKVVNWCPKHRTSLSDLEVETENRTDALYYLKYGPFTIATARPETKFGDKYVVTHPDDKRYENYKHGEKIALEWINGPIKATVIKDSSIDMEFGTGAMTITPWHDPADFDIAERHALEKEQIIDETGKLLPIAGEFVGMKINEARPKILEKLKNKGLLEKIDDKYTHAVHLCYKCRTLIEPQIRNQWFIKMKPLADKALEKIEGGEIKYIPEYYKKITVHWLQNILDWNISRQIVWGIPIPAKICDKCESGFVDLEDGLKQCEKCGAVLRKDTDTFDTWFSSGQWSFATLGYPDSKDFKTFYPTNVMETAGEIIFFWVARMVMLGLYVTNKIPFNTVYLHGLVLDAKGQKMSKSKGNVIDPSNFTKKFGTDAFRMGLVIGNTPGTSLSLSEDKIKSYKHFANKIWNASRFVILSTEDFDRENKPEFSPEDRKSIDKFNEVLREITKDMDNFKFYLVAEKLYHYFWHNFADILLERSKLKIKEGTREEKLSSQRMLVEILEGSLKALHPFMPFVTEEIWSMLPNRKNLLIVESWPNGI
jgi:valyl-tRNA synthetase